MEASYVTELQWARQDKMGTVAHEGAYWVQVAKDMFKEGVMGGYMLIDFISYKLIEN